MFLCMAPDFLNQVALLLYMLFLAVSLPFVAGFIFGLLTNPNLPRFIGEVVVAFVDGWRDGWRSRP